MTWVHSWSLKCLIMSYPGPARLCGELRIGVHSTASTRGTAGWGLGRARLDPTRSNQDLRGFEGDAASNPGIKALYVEGFSEVRSVDSCAERDWWVWPKNGMRFDKAWPGDDLDFHSGQKFWEGPTPFYPQLKMTRHVGFAWVWAKIADPMQTNSMDIQCYTHTQMEENRGPNAIQFHGYPMLHPYPNGIETYWEHTATG